MSKPLVTLVALTFATACGGPGGPGDIPSTPSIVFTVDGEESTYTTMTASRTDTHVSITGHASSGAMSYPQITLDIAGKVPGEYETKLVAGEPATSGTYTFNGSNSWSTLSVPDRVTGKIVVTEITDAKDGVVKGTFEFTGLKPSDNTEKAVTNGRFHAVLQN